MSAAEIAVPQAWKEGDPTPHLNEALAKAQGSMQPARKDSENPAFKRDGKPSTYADLTSIIEACRKPLADNGLSFVQLCRNDKEGITVTTLLLHASGERLESPFWVPVGGMTAQEYGKASTYARRFGLQALLGIGADDDDGNEASQRKREHETPEDIEEGKRRMAAESDRVAKEAADRKAEWAKDVAKFAVLGVTLTSIEQKLGHALAAPPTNQEWVTLRAWGAELKKAHDSKPSASTPPSPLKADEKPTREPTDAELAAERAERAKAEEKPKSLTIQNCLERMKEANSEEECVLIESEFVGVRPAPTKGDIAAMARAGKDRRFLLTEKKRRLTIQEQPKEDVPF